MSNVNPQGSELLKAKFARPIHIHHGNHASTYILWEAFILRFWMWKRRRLYYVQVE